jgi:hypothetical protein
MRIYFVKFKQFLYAKGVKTILISTTYNKSPPLYPQRIISITDYFVGRPVGKVQKQRISPSAVLSA